MLLMKDELNVNNDVNWKYFGLVTAVKDGTISIGGLWGAVAGELVVVSGVPVPVNFDFNQYLQLSGLWINNNPLSLLLEVVIGVKSCIIAFELLNQTIKIDD